MLRHTALPMICLLAASSCWCQGGDAAVTVHQPKTEAVPDGKRIEQDVTLSTSVASYTLRYDIIELPGDPERVKFQKWGPNAVGDIPLGIAEPSLCNWYNQGFMRWTFDEFNIHSYRAKFRVIRQSGPDAMVEWAWDTPNVKASLRFAMTAGGDKLLMFGSYEPKVEMKRVQMRLTAYPAAFEEPRQRAATTALRTLTTGSGVPLELGKERWVLLEDTLPGRPGAGSAGLLLGDAAAFQSGTLDGIGGYPEYVTLTMNPAGGRFALAFYEFPSMPDYQQTREYFRRSGDAESEALAALLQSDLDQPLEALPIDPTRATTMAEHDAVALERPAERWRPNPEPLGFPWAAKLPGGPVKVALLAARWAAYDTMELARRLEMDVTHQYLDGKGVLSSSDYWPYHGQTGVASLGMGLATRNALRICTDPSREIILVADVSPRAIPQRVMSAIVEQVRAGKGLLIATRDRSLAGWPQELTATPDDSLVAGALAAVDWAGIPGFREGDKGRVGAGPPYRGFRCGEGRVLVFTANLGAYCGLLPVTDQVFGLDAAEDHILALHALACLSAAGRTLPTRAMIQVPDAPISPAQTTALPVQIDGALCQAVLRVQDTHGKVVFRDRTAREIGDQGITLPPLPAGRDYFVDVRFEDPAGACCGLTSTLVKVRDDFAIRSVDLGPASRAHDAAPQMVGLVDGGTLTVSASAATGGSEGLQLACEARDCRGRVLGRARGPVAADGSATVGMSISRPVTVAHELHTTLLDGDQPLAVRTDIFTIPIPYPYDDFTCLMWSYAGGDLAVRDENLLCYEMGTDMMDLCHMRGYTDAGAAREYALAAQSGQRIVPYVTRIASDEKEDGSLSPSLFDEAWIESQRRSMEICCRQAAPYAPPAYTLGDENYMSRGRFEVEVSDGSTAAFREWLRERYQTIDALNETWLTAHESFDEIEGPMLLEEAADQSESFAPWFDFRDFMDTAFADLHERLADFARKEDPGAKVGWDGFLSYHWLAGYNIYKLTRNLELNQCYTGEAIQGELIRSLKPDGALTGEWGNAVADKEDGFSAITWHNLFRGHNSCWWWTSWGCDYIPFNPDMSISHMGKWYFDGAAEVKAGPGKLLLHAKRDNSGVAVLYNQADLFASALTAKIAGKSPGEGGSAWMQNHTGLSRALRDAGYELQYVAAEQIEADPDALKGYRALVLPQAVCMSDGLVEACKSFTQEGGLLLADGRAGILTGNGVVRESRPLDEVFGVKTTAGLTALTARPGAIDAAGALGDMSFPILEPDVQVTTAGTVRGAEEARLAISNPYGEGRAVMMNVPFSVYVQINDPLIQTMARTMIQGMLMQAQIAPPATLVAEKGRPQAARQVLFTDGDLKYLALFRDITVRTAGDDPVRVSMPQAAHVYDIRAGKAVADAQTDTWPSVISRGRPQVYALLPYRVTRVEAQAPESVTAGGAAPVQVRIRTDGREPGYHVVRMDVFAPGATAPHREYSANIACPAGVGAADIPFALNDTPGQWRVEFRDVATGTAARAEVTLSNE